MARKRQGWRIRQQSPGGIYTVRFTCDGRTVERSTGTSDAERAAREATRIYAHAIAHERPRPVKRLRAGAVDVAEVVAAWLISLTTTHDAGTIKTWKLYAKTHWLPFFEALHSVTSIQCGLYMRERLGKVRATTVRKELTALRSFVALAEEYGWLPKGVTVPSVPKRSTGTAHSKRRRSAAVELSPVEVDAILAALPEWSTSRKVAKFPIRARFIVAYETGLRPELIDALSAPMHYRKRQASVRITVELDKGRWARDVPLSARARTALDAVCPKQGVIFGKHDYREHIRAAAAAAMPADPGRAERFCGAHLRSARVTHLLEQPGANLPGVQFLVGHKSTATTSRYVRPSARAARDVLGYPKNSTGRRGAKERT